MDAKKLQRDKWFLLVEEQEKSGLSPSAFCKERNIKLSHLHSYRYRFKKHQQAASKVNAEKLIPIQLKPLQGTGVEAGEIRLIFRDKLQCVLSGAVERSWLKQFMEVLLSC